LQKSMPIAVITPDQAEADLFTAVLSELGFKKFTVFTSAKEAFEVCVRQLFPMFIIRMEMPELSGIVLIQKLRESGNYGLEVHLFVCNQLDSAVLNVLYEYDLNYVLSGEIRKNTIREKLQYMFAQESALHPNELEYRSARSAMYTNHLAMSEDILRKVLKSEPLLEKALVLMGDIYLRRAESTNAMQMYRKALTINSSSVGAAHKIAAVYLMRGEYTQAANALNDLVKLNPYNIKLLENAGLSNLGADRLDIAKSHMERLSGIDATNQTASEVMVSIKIKQGDYAGMIDLLRRSHDEKSLIQFLNNAGVKLSKGHDPAGALSMYKAAVEQLGDEHKYAHAIYYNMGVAWRRLDNAPRAIQLLKKALRLKSDFEKAQVLLEELEKLEESGKAS